MTHTIFDVADWFLSRSSMTHKKLQKLCYYAEAWSETLLNAPISEDAKFEAWVHGPVNRNLWNKYKSYGWGEIEQKNISPRFTEKQEEVLESVWLTYHDLTGTQLETLTHQETPWKNQRKGLSVFERSENQIQVMDMVDYYKSIYIGD